MDSRVGALERRHSTKWPIVMRDGIACGLTMMSGVIPEANGGGG